MPGVSVPTTKNYPHDIFDIKMKKLHVGKVELVEPKEWDAMCHTLQEKCHRLLPSDLDIVDMVARSDSPSASLQLLPVPISDACDASCRALTPLTFERAQHV